MRLAAIAPVSYVPATRCPRSETTSGRPFAAGDATAFPIKHDAIGVE
jgi:hypothetical protein